jgi:hypothetical protein
MACNCSSQGSPYSSVNKNGVFLLPACLVWHRWGLQESFIQAACILLFDCLAQNFLPSNHLCLILGIYLELTYLEAIRTYKSAAF